MLCIVEMILGLTIFYDFNDFLLVVFLNKYKSYWGYIIINRVVSPLEGIRFWDSQNLLKILKKKNWRKYIVFECLLQPLVLLFLAIYVTSIFRGLHLITSFMTRKPCPHQSKWWKGPESNGEFFLIYVHIS